MESFRQNLPVCSADLRSDDRWPDLRYLIAPDIVAVLSVPVSLRDAGPVGILSVYSSAPRQWSVADISAVVAYSQVMTAVLDVALRAELQGELLERLARALVANPTGRSPPDEATRS
jgi:hypothetical protein